MIKHSKHRAYIQQVNNQYIKKNIIVFLKKRRKHSLKITSLFLYCLLILLY